MAYRLLTEFERLFAGRIYKHRVSTHGDWVAVHLSRKSMLAMRATESFPLLERAVFSILFKRLKPLCGGSRRKPNLLSTTS
jgi:hypothetical protein